MPAARILQLMRVELERAKLHDYPISCMVIGLDGLAGRPDEPLPEEDAASGESAPASLSHRLGRRLSVEIFRLLKAVTFRAKVQGLGLRRDAFVLALFPHVAPDHAERLAKELAEEVRGLKHPAFGESGPTASIGIGHNLHPGAVTLESLLVEAETGLNIAQSAGGDRVVVWKAIESELEQLRSELDKQIQTLDVRRDAADAADAWGAELLEKILAAFGEEQNPPKAVLRLEKRIIDLVGSELERLAELPLNSELEQRLGEIDMLERRVRKLTTQLDKSEAEIKRLASMKVTDDGVASIYRTVQGLSEDEDNAETKKAMLSDIFAANLALREQAKG